MPAEISPGMPNLLGQDVSAVLNRMPDGHLKELCKAFCRAVLRHGDERATEAVYTTSKE